VHDHIRLHQNLHVPGSYFQVMGNFLNEKWDNNSQRQTDRQTRRTYT